MKQLLVWWQHCLPQNFLSRVLGMLANCRCQWVKNTWINWFIRHFAVNLSEAVVQDPKQFPDFNAFFTRQLKKGARHLADATVISPVDGTISAIGYLANDKLLQAKGRSYSLCCLLGRDEKLAHQFANGAFLTAYLAPKDYHRIHMPLTGRLLTMQYIPGRLFSVNGQSVKHIDRLFARNERVVCTFASEHGLFAMIAVGAMVVGSITTVWHGVVNTPRRNKPHTWHYDAQRIVLEKGTEFGHFKLGSTVILIFQARQIAWKANLQGSAPLKMGQGLAEGIA